MHRQCLRRGLAPMAICAHLRTLHPSHVNPRILDDHDTHRPITRSPAICRAPKEAHLFAWPKCPGRLTHRRSSHPPRPVVEQAAALAVRTTLSLLLEGTGAQPIVGARIAADAAKALKLAAEAVTVTIEEQTVQVTLASEGVAAEHSCASAQCAAHDRVFRGSALVWVVAIVRGSPSCIHTSRLQTGPSGAA